MQFVLFEAFPGEDACVDLAACVDGSDGAVQAEWAGAGSPGSGAFVDPFGYEVLVEVAWVACGVVMPPAREYGPPGVGQARRRRRA